MKKKLLILMLVTFLLPVIGFNQKAIAEESNSETDSDEISTLLMEMPPFEYYLADDVSIKNSPIKLQMISSKENEIVDDDKWFKKNKLSLKTYEVPNSFRYISGNLPEELDATWDDLIVTSAFYDSSYTYCIYGANFSEGYILNIYDTNTFDLEYSLDFSNYRYSPKYIKTEYDYIDQEILWATIKDDILYIANAHSSYSKNSKNMNGYITAIDLNDLSILWRTKSLVCNSYNFLIVDDVIFCGYGYTDEPDYLYQIDLNNGKVLSKTSVKSAVSYVVKKGSYLYIRTYNTDYKFKIKK